VVLEEHFGPPGFGEDPKTDSKEMIAKLVLDAPITVEGDSSDSLNRTTYTNVRRIHMARGRIDLTFSTYVGRRVTASGTLYEGHTGHHHTDVLITVQSIAAR
jgi:uncharacterized protein DUF4431